MSNSRNVVNEILDEIKNAESEKYKKRLQGVLYKYKGQSVKEIAGLLDASPQTIRNWIERFETSGFDGLKEKPRSGRPSKLPHSIEVEIKNDLKGSPQNYGYPQTLWNKHMVIDRIQRKYKIHISEANAHRILQSTELRVKKSKKTGIQDKRKQRNSFEQKVLRFEKDDYELWFIDSMHLGKHTVGKNNHVKFKKDHFLLYAIQFGFGKSQIISDVTIKPIDETNILKLVKQVAEQIDSTKVLLILHETKLTRKLTNEIHKFFPKTTETKVLYSPEKTFEYPSIRLFDVINRTIKGLKEFLVKNTLNPEQSKREIKKELDRLFEESIGNNQ